MNWLKWLIQLLLPHLIEGVKYIYNQITLKKMREQRRAEAVKRAEVYANSRTPEEVESTFENRP